MTPSTSRAKPCARPTRARVRARCGAARAAGDSRTPVDTSARTDLGSDRARGDLAIDDHHRPGGRVERVVALVADERGRHLGEPHVGNSRSMSGGGASGVKRSSNKPGSLERIQADRAVNRRQPEAGFDARLFRSKLKLERRACSTRPVTTTSAGESKAFGSRNWPSTRYS